jgi:hypothetical protein
VLIEGELGDLAPPVQFTLRGVADWVVQITPTTRLGYDLLAGDGECYGGETTSVERFWELATLPEPPAVTVTAWGRFEGGVLLATTAGICFPSQP